MIYKRGEIYWYDFRVNKQRHRGSTGLKSKRAAQEFHDDLKQRKKREARGLETTITSTHTIYGAVDDYLAYSKIHLRASTLKIKESTWKTLKKAIPDGPLATLGLKDLQAFHSYGARIGMKNSSINHHVDELRAFTHWASIVKGKREKLLSHNPLSDSDEWDKLPVPVSVDRVISDQDFERLIAAVPEDLKEIIWVDWQTGMRVSNIVRLRYDQIDFEAGGIELHPDEMKKGKSVFIDLEPELVEWFRKRRAAHPNHVYVWPSPQNVNKHRNVASVSQRFSIYAKKLGINATFHSIRHTFATRWIKNGVSLYMVGKFLSHKCLQSTQRYAHVEDLESQKEAKKRVVQIKAPRLPGKLKVVGGEK
tara:strand:- start:10 stop:1101 length:1092 start_codon:yes stop_codon:yes gene_type:complete